MKYQLLINEISLAIATVFLICAASTNNIYLIALGIIMIGYSSTKIRKLKGN